MINEVTIFATSIKTTFFLYTDPGSGMLILQMLLAAGFGVLFYFRRIKDKIFGRKAPDKIEGTETNPSEINSSQTDGDIK